MPGAPMIRCRRWGLATAQDQTPTYVAAGAFAYGSTTVAPAYPGGLAAGDAIFCVVGTKPDTATINAAAGWTLVATIGGGGGGVAADSGPCDLAIFREDTVTGSESGTVSFSITSGNSSFGQIVVFRKLPGLLWEVAAATGVDTTANATWAVVCSTNPGLKAEDMCLVAGCIPTDVQAGAQFSAHTITATGATFGTINEIAEATSGTGNDIAGYTAYGPITAGTASAAPTLGATMSGGTQTNYRGPGIIVRIRAKYPTPPGSFNPATRVVVGWWKAASANVTLSGADVTSWTDLSGNANSAVTPGFGNNPSFVASDAGISGHDSVEFDNTNGDGEGLDADGTGALVTGPFTVSCVARIANLTSWLSVWGISKTAGSPDISLSKEISQTTLGITSSDISNFAQGSFTIDTNWHVYTLVILPKVGVTAGVAAMYIDGSAVTLTDYTIQANVDFNNFKIGMYQGNGLAGRIAEIAVYNEAFDATTVRENDLYMASDKGITIP